MPGRVGVDAEVLGVRRVRKTTGAVTPSASTCRSAWSTSSTSMSRWSCCGCDGSGHCGGTWSGASCTARRTSRPWRVVQSSDRWTTGMSSSADQNCASASMSAASSTTVLSRPIMARILLSAPAAREAQLLTFARYGSLVGRTFALAALRAPRHCTHEIDAYAASRRTRAEAVTVKTAESQPCRAPAHRRHTRAQQGLPRARRSGRSGW